MLRLIHRLIGRLRAARDWKVSERLGREMELQAQFFK